MHALHNGKRKPALALVKTTNETGGVRQTTISKT
jgi:hypothetical protein